MTFAMAVVSFAVVAVTFAVAMPLAFAVRERGGGQQQGEDQYGCDYRCE